MTTSTRPESVASTRLRLGLAWVIVLALLILALSPVLTRSHVEGFTYFTELMSMLLPDLSAAEPLWTANTGYYYMSRPGIIWAMAPLSAIAPGNGYNLLMWFALPVILSGLVMASRSLTGASWLSCFAALLVLPIVIEANYFHNDNVLAVGLSAWAVALVVATKSGGGAFAAGMLYSAAVLCRLDQVLLGPFFAMLLVLRASSVSEAMRRAVSMALGFVLVHGLFGLLDVEPVNPLHRISVVSDAVASWERGGLPLSFMVLRDLSALLMAVGLGLPAIIAGAIALVRKGCIEVSAEEGAWKLFQARALPVLLIGYPFVIYALSAFRYYDPRGYMVMLPMLAPFAAMGLQRWVIGPLSGFRGNAAPPTAWQGAITAFLVIPFLVPGVPLLSNVIRLPVETENAAPTLTGRIWYTGSWRIWQERGFHTPEREMDAFLQGFVDRGDPAALVLSTTWTNDRRFQNRLAKSGFSPTESLFPACAPVSETWSHPSGTVVTHVRMHLPALPLIEQHTAALFLTHGADCIASVPQEQRYAFQFYGIYLTHGGEWATLEPSDNGYFVLSDANLERLKELAEGKILDFAPVADPAETAQALIAAALERMN